MECSSTTAFAIALMSDVDAEDVRYGQLLTLATGLLFVLAGRLILFFI